MGKTRRNIVAIKGPAQKQASHDAVAMAANKKKFLAALAAGLAPGCAAKEIEINRSTAYNWKRDDEEFATRWDEAVQTSLDRLETVMYQVALTPEGQKEREFQLRHRRPEVYHNMQENLLTATTQSTNYYLTITLQEQIETLERLGLPVPVIESDREEDYASDPEETDNP
jgi:hypothetical protein